MIKNKNFDLHHFDQLLPEETIVETLADGVVFRKMPFYYTDYEGDNLVNIYTVEISNSSEYKYGIRFSAFGDYCVDLTKSAVKKIGDSLVCSMNCNFGLIVDDHDILPPDISYNLHIEDGELYQLPVADKTALLINEEGKIELQFNSSYGCLTIGERTFNWIGSMTKQSISQGRIAQSLIVYNSFNRGLLEISDSVTGTRKGFDPEQTYTPLDKMRVDLIIDRSEGHLLVVDINPETHTHFFAGYMIISVPKIYAGKIQIGDSVTNIVLDRTKLDEYKYATTVGAILTRDSEETEKNIEASLIIQTRLASKVPAIKEEHKFCRGCLVQDVDRIIFFLADARKKIKGQEGFTIGKLRDVLETLYPSYIRAVNVDGGHAAKIVINRSEGYDVFGNLHYKIWPTGLSKDFQWNGYLGRKVPAVIYIYR